MEYTKRDLAILYMIVKCNQVEYANLKRRHLPPESWPSAGRPVTITKLWNKNEDDGGVLNRFFTEMDFLPPINSAETIYRCLRKLYPCQMIYTGEATPNNQFSPTPNAYDVVRVLDDIGDPMDWPNMVHIDETGFANWETAEY